jgi:agmatine/peptidylarginine deiminase
MPSQVYRMPPEWAPHDGTWLSWPHNRETWPASLASAQTALTDAVVALAAGEVYQRTRCGASFVSTNDSPDASRQAAC